jgi:DNA-binding transcriptional ArsR family regulator
MAMIKASDDATEVTPSVAALLHAFSDASRLTILRHLALGEHRVVDLTAHLGLAQSTVSKHLACLRECGLVTVEPRGRASVYALAHIDAVNDVLAAAERLLEQTGYAAALHATSVESPHGETAR